jgi:hypothetical protein
LGRRRASKDGSLAEDSGASGEDSHRHFRNFVRGKLKGGELGLMEIAKSGGIIGSLFADGTVDSDLVVEVLLVVFGDLDVTITGGLDGDGIVGETDGGLVVNQEIGTTWQ